ncbi:MAG: hypothetical protein KTR29_08470 [Rhodothermaceae bacterium]|nr:hypothetical protein [Rhodothermaceae bacterium]
MKAIHKSRLVLVLLVALLVGPLMARQAEAQSCQVTVRIFPVNPGKAELQNSVRTSVRDFLCAVDAGSPAVGNIEISAEDISILEASQALHPVYKILVIPVVPSENGIAYQVRGLHLDHDTAQNLQLALSLDADGNVVMAEVLDDQDREDNWASSLDEIGSMPQGEAVLNLIKRLEDAYNSDALGVANGANTMPALATLLQEATINVSKLISGAPTSTSYPSSSRYINALVRLIGRASGAPEITYELVQIYPHRDAVSENGTGAYEEASLYRVALIQHWMFPPDNYIDTDYVSLDVEINPSPYIKARNAGRGSFVVNTNPDGVQVTEFNGKDWKNNAVFTPLTEFINAPWQYHYLTLNDHWYNSEYLVVSPEDVLSHRELTLGMEHKEGNIDLTVLPDDDNVTVRVEDGAGNLDEATFVDGGVLRIHVDQLKGKPDSLGAITSDHATRGVRLVVEKTYYQTVDTTVFLPSPDLYPLTIEMRKKKGRLAVTATPSPSAVSVNANPFGSTPLDAEVEVTGDDDPLGVVVRNDECNAGIIEQDCMLHIPSESRSATIVEDQTAEMHFDLAPFIVRNLTKTADIDVELGSRDTRGALPIEVGLMDNDGRNRSYIVDFEVHDRSTGEPLFDLSPGILECTAENACLGKGIRPGAYSMLWDLAGAESSMPDNAVPVLTLRRRSVCWPCVLIPAAAGVAAAYIFPRTGSGGPLPFLPPPRPDDIP